MINHEESISNSKLKSRIFNSKMNSKKTLNMILKNDMSNLVLEKSRLSECRPMIADTSLSSKHKMFDTLAKKSPCKKTGSLVPTEYLLKPMKLTKSFVTPEKNAFEKWNNSLSVSKIPEDFEVNPQITETNYEIEHLDA